MIANSHLQLRRQLPPGGFGPLAGLIYATPIALALWALIALTAAVIF